jgi:hypothetical protein
LYTSSIILLRLGIVLGKVYDIKIEKQQQHQSSSIRINQPTVNKGALCLFLR